MMKGRYVPSPEYLIGLSMESVFEILSSAQYSAFPRLQRRALWFLRAVKGSISLPTGKKNSSSLVPALTNVWLTVSCAFVVAFFLAINSVDLLRQCFVSGSLSGRPPAFVTAFWNHWDMNHLNLHFGYRQLAEFSSLLFMSNVTECRHGMPVMCINLQCAAQRAMASAVTLRLSGVSMNTWRKRWQWDVWGARVKLLP